MYVALTRAKERVTASWAARRRPPFMFRGEPEPTKLSPYIKPLLEKARRGEPGFAFESTKKADGGGYGRYGGGCRGGGGWKRRDHEYGGDWD